MKQGGFERMSLAGGNMNVMIVDDEFIIRTTVNEVLTADGFNVVEAAGGVECMDALRSGFRGVVLMDVMMPGMDGWDTIRKIVDNDLHRGIAIVMLTAMDVPGDKMAGLQEYVIDYKTKPFPPEALVGDIREYFRYLDRAGNG